MVLQMTSDEQLGKYLKQSGHKVTRARLAVFNYLVKAGPTSVFDVLSAVGSQADRASLYRTLTLYRQLGVIEDFVSGGQKLIELSDHFQQHHHHMVCLDCGRSQDLTDELVENYLEKAVRRTGFLPSGHHIEISGLCAKCQTAQLGRP
jgi:Fur family transcriptional regulator, ferric uptake regulator